MKQYRYFFTYIVTLFVGLLIGYLIFSGASAVDPHAGHAHADGSTDENTVWTCSMHPQIRQNEPGVCPICAMDLIPASSGGGDPGDQYTLTMTPEAVRLAEIRTTEVRLDAPSKQIRVPGVVRIAEDRLSVVSAQFSGRVVSQQADYTGRRIQLGEPLLSIWSPDLIAAQRELLDAAEVSDHTGMEDMDHDKMENMDDVLLMAARSKLRFWQLTDDQIKSIERGGTVLNEIYILAPRSGVIITRNVRPDDVINPGMVLYEIADLTKVWLEFEVYEQDLGAVRPGVRVRYGAQGSGDERMSGTVSWVDPILDDERRTARIRVEVENADGKWLPGMLLSGVIEVPMGREQVVIPESAVLWTGRRSVVYVADESSGDPLFTFKEVVLGDRVGDDRIVASGLEPGQHVVTNGAFKVDAEFQLRDKFSMLNRGLDVRRAVLEGERPGSLIDSEGNELSSLRELTGAAFRSELDELLDGYFKVKDALFASDANAAMREVRGLRQVLGSVEGEGLGGEARDQWTLYHERLRDVVEAWMQSGDIEQQRSRFFDLSRTMYEVVERYGVNGVVWHQYCPMAFDNSGATWLNRQESIANPYLPETMAGCGEVLSQVSL
jgi:Cu(I)/Ag(I) efflux system membrane fusion protein